MKKIMSALFISLFVLPLAACDTNDGPAEELGENVDNAVEEMQEETKAAAEEVEDTAEEAADDDPWGSFTDATGK